MERLGQSSGRTGNGALKKRRKKEANLGRTERKHEKEKKLENVDPRNHMD